MCLGIVVSLSTFITSPSTCSPSVGSPSHPPLCSHPSYQPGSGESGSIALEKKCGWELWFLFLPFFLIIPISKFPQALALAVHPAVMLFHHSSYQVQATSSGVLEVCLNAALPVSWYVNIIMTQICCEYSMHQHSFHLFGSSQ